MSEFAQAVWTYVSKHPGFRASQIKHGIRAHYPKKSTGYTSSTLQRLMLSGFLKAMAHSTSSPARVINAYYVDKEYDDDAFTQWQKQHMEELGQSHTSKPPVTTIRKKKPVTPPTDAASELLRHFGGEVPTPLKRESVVRIDPTAIDTPMHEHTFMLRPGCFIKMTLPEDLNEADIERLLEFMYTVKFK